MENPKVANNFQNFFWYIQEKKNVRIIYIYTSIQLYSQSHTHTAEIQNKHQFQKKQKPPAKKTRETPQKNQYVTFPIFHAQLN